MSSAALEWCTKGCGYPRGCCSEDSQEGSGEEDRVKFLQEATIMGQFKHHNVVEMYGVGEPVSLYDNTFVGMHMQLEHMLIKFHEEDFFNSGGAVKSSSNGSSIST